MKTLLLIQDLDIVIDKNTLRVYDIKELCQASLSDGKLVSELSEFTIKVLQVYFTENIKECPNGLRRILKI